MANWMRSARVWAVTAALCTMVTVVGCGEPAANKPADTKPGASTTTPAKPEKPATATTPESGSTTTPKAGGGVDVPEEKK